MKAQLASDLHLDQLQRYFPRERLILPAAGADALILAGDIAHGTLGIDLFKDWPVPVLYLAGNHEFYGSELEQTRRDLQSSAANHNMNYLDNSSVQMNGIRFLGATLWTDYLLFPQWSQEQLMLAAQDVLRDHHVIRYGSESFTPAAALAEHCRSRQWLEQQLDTPFDGKTVVITHHAPHPLSIHPRHAHDPITAAFVSNLEALVRKADYWFHGHVHDSFDYSVGKCRVVVNPRGYASNKHAAATPAQLKFENPQFRPYCVIEL